MELWSIKERMAYTKANATIKNIDGIYVYATPSGEILATRVK
jgi:hypothetical protein